MVIFFNRKEKDKYLLLIEPGGIGDYIFCRPFFKYFKESLKYKDYKIIYLAKDIYADFVSTFDGEYFDKIIAYNTKALERNKNYQKYLYSEINSYHIDTLINLRGITPFIKDIGFRRRLVKSVKARKKIVDVIPDKNNNVSNLKISMYNEPIIDYWGKEYNYLFENERRRLFFEKILELKIPKTELDFDKNNLLFDYINRDFIVLSICTNDSKRLYPREKWIHIAKYILENKPKTYLYFIGTNNEKNKIDEVVSAIDSPYCCNLAGMIPISVLPMFLSKSKMLLGVETGTVHIANLVGCKTICFSNGLSYGRFHPYPNNKSGYLYPEKFEEYIKTASQNELIKIYCGESSFDTNTSDVDVIEILKGL